MNKNRLLQFLLTFKSFSQLEKKKCLTNSIRGFIKFAMFEEQIKMFEENKQQLDLPFSATHTQSLLGTAHKSNCSLTLGTDGSWRPH